MSWISRLGRYYGFEKPYDFKVAIPFLVGGLAFVAAAVWAALRLGLGTVPANTPAAWFPLYVAAGFLVAALLARRPRLSLIVFVWFVAEVALGLSSRALAPKADASLFTYHPLLQGVPTPGYNPRHEPVPAPRFTGKRKYVIVHNSLGMRGTEEDLDKARDKILIVAYGGSSTYDVGVGQGETWVERLNEDLGPSYAVLNAGVPGYSTSEHVIQTAFYGDMSGRYPECAIYYIGWNDIRNAYVPGLDNAYADYHLISQLGNLSTRRSESLGLVSPLLTLLVKLLAGAVDTVPFPRNLGSLPPGSGDDPVLEHIFDQNVATITAINKSRNIETVFVPQMLNVVAWQRDGRSSFMPLLATHNVWPMMARFNGLLRDEAGKLGAGFVDPGIDSFVPDDFVDSGHFSPKGAAKFASLIAPGIRQLCH